MSKELFIAAHEQMVEEYMLANPGADWNEAYEATANGAWDRARDSLADMVDRARQRAKDDRQ